jgi:UPF0042 nucleotide-binding protein
MGDLTSDLIIVTGMTGAGRSTAAKALEDQGCFVIDNLPPQLLPDVVRLVSDDRDDVPQIAVVVDVRSRRFFNDLQGAVDRLSQLGIRSQVLFLEASNEVLVRRQEAARRPHPLQGGARLLDGILRERELVRDLRGSADVLIDTSSLNVHELATKVAGMLSVGQRPVVRATVVSFGFKYGIPVDADMVVDMRFLPNPHWEPDLRPLTGFDPRVVEYMSRGGKLDAFSERLGPLLDFLIPEYIAEGKAHLAVAVGCTGGRHRSVAIVEALAARLRARGDVEVDAVHRDVGHSAR